MTTTSRKQTHKYFQLDASKIKRALDLAITEQKRNRLAWQATERCLKSDVEIRDVYEYWRTRCGPHSSQFHLHCGISSWGSSSGREIFRPMRRYG
jgi:hypothetical protein